MSVTAKDFVLICYDPSGQWNGCYGVFAWGVERGKIIVGLDKHFGTECQHEIGSKRSINGFAIKISELG